VAPDLSELIVYLDGDNVVTYDDDFDILNWWHEHEENRSSSKKFPPERFRGCTRRPLPGQLEESMPLKILRRTWNQGSAKIQ
jgi:hypothetical protein